MIPPRSPYSLIQEDLWPNEWFILVSCILLNCTSRKQVERVWGALVELAPTPEALLSRNRDAVRAALTPLGFKNRRTDALYRMTAAYVTPGWSHARELPGIGEYGARAWELFVLGVVGDAPPRDGALVQYWNWRRYHSV